MSLLTIESLTNKQIMKLIKRADEFRKGATANIKYPIANLFFENSTRTLMSFLKAQRNLNMESYHLPISTSSTKKGELLTDTIDNLHAIGINNFVIRSSKIDYWNEIKNKSVRIINGGSGVDSHPTQALLDALTIYQEFGTLENLKIAIVGDLKYSRVYWSNKRLLQKFGTKVYDVAPRKLYFGEPSKNNNLEDVIGKVDIVMFLRVQHERHEELFDINKYNETFGLNKSNVSKLKDKAIFMHPGPINQDVEITADISFDHPKSRILKQVENGVYMRMAILEMFCEKYK